MIKLGDYNKMTVVKEVDFGIYLDGGDEGEILMPSRYVPEGVKPGDELEVFVYLDQDEPLRCNLLHDRLCADSGTPGLRIPVRGNSYQ